MAGWVSKRREHHILSMVEKNLGAGIIAGLTVMGCHCKIQTLELDTGPTRTIRVALKSKERASDPVIKDFIACLKSVRPELKYPPSTRLR